MYECKYCKKEFEDYHQVGGHTVSCTLNPKRNAINLKRSLSHTEKIEYAIKCKGCNKDCIVHATEKAYEKGDYNKYCSRGCANARKHTKAVREKISNSLRGRPNERRGKSMRKELREKLFGTECFFCTFERRTVLHKKDGKKHKPSKTWSIAELKKVNPDEYVLLCYRCHLKVHWCMKYLGMIWEEIEQRFASVRQRQTSSLPISIDRREEDTGVQITSGA